MVEAGTVQEETLRGIAAENNGTVHVIRQTLEQALCTPAGPTTGQDESSKAASIVEQVFDLERDTREQLRAIDELISTGFINRF